MTIRCSLCESDSVDLVGPILHRQPMLVAGVALNIPESSFSLYRCRECALQFKFPTISEAKLALCYARASADHWQRQPDPRRRRFDQLRERIASHARGNRILDVGCFHGAFLSYLGPGYDRYGVEPSKQAAALAERRGVTILGDSLDALDPDTLPFDVIVAFDVIEHVPTPSAFFGSLRRWLAPGGILVTLTGDTQSLAWRLLGSRYWYCNLPEHVSFYCRRTMQWIAQRYDLRELECRSTRHKRSGPHAWGWDVLKSAVYLAGRRTRGLGNPAWNRALSARPGPTIQSARDHFVWVARAGEPRHPPLEC